MRAALSLNRTPREISKTSFLRRAKDRLGSRLVLAEPNWPEHTPSAAAFTSNLTLFICLCRIMKREGVGARGPCRGVVKSGRGRIPGLFGLPSR
ncbi:hypothetical protein GWI33_015305 [Rhynchophorus ferrugineus]|uniref:Uncharacterized protein n=1 Tax=Rhynchophorus ferrugineus TaxID=354439 RepID=A0A834M4N2_RHYFE|nr:hypothetical protein GWI33_015305 [Rhynchophorus ferrugineus]